jgi:flavin reductase (DIM6/NTAB) family NADH-FMN oxidoreductase RutF
LDRIATKLFLLMSQDFYHNFKRAVSKFTTGVTIATTYHDNKHYGVTINAFASLSLHPTLILFNLDVSAQSLTAFLKSQFFNINILAQEQLPLAKHFATNQDNKFVNIDYQQDQNNVALLSGNLASIHCKLHSSTKVGDHYIIIGEVYDLAYCDIKQPLTYFNSHFS